MSRHPITSYQINGNKGPQTLAVAHTGQFDRRFVIVHDQVYQGSIAKQKQQYLNWLQRPKLCPDAPGRSSAPDARARKNFQKEFVRVTKTYNSERNARQQKMKEEELR